MCRKTDLTVALAGQLFLVSVELTRAQFIFNPLDTWTVGGPIL